MESESVSEKGKVAMTTLFVLFRRVSEAFSQVIYKPYQAVALNQVYSIKEALHIFRQHFITNEFLYPKLHTQKILGPLSVDCNIEGILLGTCKEDLK